MLILCFSLFFPVDFCILSEYKASIARHTNIDQPTPSNDLSLDLAHRRDFSVFPPWFLHPENNATSRRRQGILGYVALIAYPPFPSQVLLKPALDSHAVISLLSELLGDHVDHLVPEL